MIIEHDTTREKNQRLRDLKTLAARYESSDAYNRPAIEFVLRQQHGHYTATGE